MNKETLPDLVAVVRCEDCVNFRRDYHKQFIYCNARQGLTNIGFNSYCSKGEKREAENDG